MKISYNWLKEYLDFDLTTDELKEKLTFGGIEVEDIEQIGENLKQFKVGHIIEKSQHPQAEKLSVCKVQDGQEILQIVCGAPNCEAGQKIILAPIGTLIDGRKIKKTKLRGIVSFGMICSEEEVGISDNNDGIAVLSQNAIVGQNICEHFKLEDVVYEVEITPNRPDLLGMVGVARDLSAMLNLSLLTTSEEGSQAYNLRKNDFSIDIKDSANCSRYSGTLIKNIVIKDSPKWLVNRINSVGIKSINNVVDITNYVMMEYGHPLHAFDFSKIKGNKIIIRNALENEKFSALDKAEYLLEQTDIIIADEEKSVALAGIIGGTNSNIDSNTVEILLEVANFKQQTIRKTANRLKITTDSGYRFERGMSDGSIPDVKRRAIELICQLAGGEIVSEQDNYQDNYLAKVVSLRLSRVKKLLSIVIDRDIIIKYLNNLSCKVSGDSETLKVEVPHFRKDLTREIDLIEEVIRLHGYNNVPQLNFSQKIMNKKTFFLKRKIEDFFIGLGFHQVVNWTFSDPESFEKLELPEDDFTRKAIPILNPIGIRYSIMRTTLLPSLLKNSLNNIKHSETNFRIFECGKTYHNDNSKLGKEELKLTGIICGNVAPNHWSENTQKMDFFVVKGIIEELGRILRIPKISFTSLESSYYQTGVAAEASAFSTKFVSFGKIDTKILNKFGIEEELYSFELNIDALMKLANFDYQETPSLPRFPSVKRDLSFVISKKFKYSEIIKKIEETEKRILSDISVFDDFQGKGIPCDSRSLSISLQLSSKSKTLTDSQVNRAVNKIIKMLKEEFNIEMR